MKEYKYKTSGTCAGMILFKVDDEDRVHDINFIGGCNGNGQGVSMLAEGMTKDEIIERLSGIKCGFKPTSCPDQLARALSEI